MKNLVKFGIIISIFMILFSYNYCFAITAKSQINKFKPDLSSAETSIEEVGIVEIVQRILGVIRVITGFLAVVVVTYMGYQMATDSAQNKKNVKQEMIVLLIGIIAVFGATIIANFIVKLFES